MSSSYTRSNFTWKSVRNLINHGETKQRFQTSSAAVHEPHSPLEDFYTLQMSRLFYLIVFFHLLTALLVVAAQYYFLSLEYPLRYTMKTVQTRSAVESNLSHRRGIRENNKHSHNEVSKVHVQTPRRLYLTYQPPDGGWNNHRIALENALIMAKLLNRTLMVHPLASHDMAIFSRRKNLVFWRNLEKRWGINWVYNLMAERDLVPISEVLDLQLMRSVLDVHEVKTNHKKFLEEFANFKWHHVCHSDALGFWVDAIPSENVSSTREIEFVPNNSSRSIRACPREIERYMNASKPVIRQILSELKNERADIIYLSQDTSYKANVRLFHKEDAKQALQWILNNIKFSPQIYQKAFQILSILPQPFNAIHVRRTDHKISASMAPSHWLNSMAQKHFLKISAALYVATDEPNKAWFEPFHRAGYQLYFSDEFFNPSGRSFDMDIKGLYDQVICIHAKLFIGSKSSSFSGFIYRSRGEVMRRDGLILSHMPVGWFAHKLKRQN